MTVPTGPTIEQLLQQACAELERSLRAGEACSAKQILESYGDLATNKEAALELIYTEFVVRNELGEKPLPASWIGDFPLWETDLNELFQVHALIGENEFDTIVGPEATTDGLAGVPSKIPPGTCVGQYELLEEIGRGGMGIVFKARQRGLNRFVAVKMILSANCSRIDRARFRLEAEAASKLQHPNIVQIHEVGSQNGTPYMAMELVEGSNLQQQLAERPLSPQAAATLVKTLSLAVDFAHQHEIIHRDLKPANILQATDGIPKLTDFGLAKHVSAGSLSDPDEEDKGLTRTGVLIGTPSYMSPEQVDQRFGAIGPATDIYALGVILYEALTGRLPFNANTSIETLEQVRTQEPVPPRRLIPKIPSDIETICLKCLEKEPRHRYVSAALLADDLGRALRGEPIHARRTRAAEQMVKWVRRQPVVSALMAAVVVAVIAGFVGIVWQWSRADTQRGIAEKSAGDALAAQAKAEAALEAEKRQFYFRQIALAYREFSSHNTRRVLELLEDTPPKLRHWEWHYLYRLCHEQLVTLVGHTQPVRALCCSPDGKLIASCGGSKGNVPGEVKIWDMKTGVNVLTLGGHNCPIGSAAFSPDGRILASGGIIHRSPRVVGSEVKLWDVATGTEIGSIRDGAYCVQFSPDGRFLGIGGRQIRLHSTEDWSLVRAYQFDSSAGSTQIPSVSPNGMARIWDTDIVDRRFDWINDIQVMRGLGAFSSHWGGVHSIDFSTDSTRIASVTGDGKARIWDTDNGEELQVITTGFSGARHIAFHPNNDELAVGNSNGDVQIWNWSNNEEIARFHTRAGSLTSLDFSPDGRWLSVCSNAGAEIWSTATGSLMRKFSGHTRHITLASFAQQGRQLVTAGADQTLKLWDLTSAEEPQEFWVQLAGIGDIAFSPNGTAIAVASKMDRNTPVDSRQFNLCLWDSDQKNVERTYEGHKNWLTSVAFSPDGKRIATGSHDKQTIIWDAGASEPLLKLTGHTEWVTCVTFASDDVLVSGSDDATVRFWNARTGKLVLNKRAHDGGVTSLANVPAHRLVVSAGADGVVRIWSPEGDEVANATSPLGSIHGLALSADGQHLATASDRTVHIWEFEAILDRGVSVPRVTITGHTSPITGLAFSPDGKRLATAASDYNLNLWDVASGQEALRLPGNDLAPKVLFSPDGQRLFLTGGGSITVYNAEQTKHENKSNQLTAERHRTPEQQRALVWHESQRAQSLRHKQSFAAVFHAEQELEILTQLAAESPEDPTYAKRLADLHSTLATSLNRLGRTAESIDQLQLALEHSSEDPAYQNRLAWALVICDDTSLRDAPRAVALARAAVAQDWANARYRETLGIALYRAGVCEEAIKQLEMSIARDRQLRPAWLFLAMAHRRLDHERPAFDWRALVQKEDDGDALFESFGSEVEVLFGAESIPNDQPSGEQFWTAIVAGYGHFIEEQPTTWWLFDQRAYAHASLDRWQACADDISRAYELTPQFHDLLVVEAGALLMAGNDDAYVQICDKLIEQLRAAPSHQSRYRVAKSCLFAPTSPLPPEELITLAEQLIQGDPNSGRCLQLLALAHYRAGNHQATIDSANDAIQKTSEWDGHVASSVVLALTYQKLGQTTKFAECKAAIDVWMRTKHRPFNFSDFVLHPHDWLQSVLLQQELYLLEVK